MHRTVEVSPGEGTPSPPKRTIPALPGGPRAGAGALVVMARVGRKPGVPAQILFLAGIIPCPGPWRYHPGRGRGGSPLPVGKNHTSPSPGPPRKSGGYRGDSPGGAQAPGASPDPVPRRCHPMHRTVGVSPGKGPGLFSSPQCA